MDKLDRQSIEEHNTAEWEREEQETVEYLLSREPMPVLQEPGTVHPLFDELLKDFQRNLLRTAELMRKL